MWTKTPAGEVIHINGDPNMPKEEIENIGLVADLLGKNVSVPLVELCQIMALLSQIRLLQDESHHENIRKRASNLYSNLRGICREQGIDTARFPKIDESGTITTL